MHLIEIESIDDLTEFMNQNGLVGQPEWRSMAAEDPGVAAVSNGRIVGAARLYRQWLHPLRWRFAIYVEPASRRQGIGTALLANLVQHHASAGAELQTGVTSTDHAGLAFLDRTGFALLMTTRLGSLNVVGVPMSWRQRSERAERILARRTITMSTLRAVPEAYEQVAWFHEQMYRQQHAWDPPRALTLEDCIDLFMNNVELDPAMQFLAVASTGVCAVASLRHTESARRLDLGWFGMAKVSPKLQESIHRASWGRCIDAAIRRNATVDIEIDCVDPKLNEIVDELPVTWNADWLTFRRPSEPGRHSRRDAVG